MGLSFSWRVPMANPLRIAKPAENGGKIRILRGPQSGCVEVVRRRLRARRWLRARAGATGGRWGGCAGWVRSLQAGQSWLGACAVCSSVHKIGSDHGIAARLTDRSGMAKKIGRRSGLGGPWRGPRGGAGCAAGSGRVSAGRSVSNLTTNIREIWTFQSRTPDTPG